MLGYPALPCRAVMALLLICVSRQDHPPVCQCTFIPTLSLEKHERQGWGNRCKALKGVHHMPRLRGAKAPLFHEISDSNLGSSQGRETPVRFTLRSSEGVAK